jgi:hypothetical protein
MRAAEGRENARPSAQKDCGIPLSAWRCPTIPPTPQTKHLQHKFTISAKKFFALNIN